MFPAELSKDKSLLKHILGILLLGICNNFISQFIALLSALCMTMIGPCFVWMAPLMVILVGPNSPVPMTTAETSWLASVVELGMLAANIPIGILADRFGRKTVIMFAGPVALCSWILLLTTRDIAVLFVVRVLQGFTMAIGFIVVPTYLAEISEPRIRGLLSGQFQTLYNIGTLYAYATGAYLSYNTYAICLLFPPLLFMLLFVFMPETPYYYLMKQQPELAERSLCWLRATEDVGKEFQTMSANVEEDMKLKANWKDLIATKSDRKALLIVLLVSFIRYMNGLTAISLYISQTLSEAAHGAIDYNVASIALAAILTITTFIAAFLSDSIGRKPLLIVSSLGSVLFCSVVAIFYYIDTKTSLDATPYTWIMVASLIGFFIICNIGIAPLVQTIQAECFPSRTRSIGGAFTQMVCSCISFASIKMYQEIEGTLGVYFNYVIFTAVSLIGSILLYFILPETAGKILGNIETDLNDSSTTNEVGTDKDKSAT